VNNIVPTNGNLEEIKIINHPTLTYRLQSNKNRITKKIDSLEAMEQFVYKVLHTNRYKYEIYNWNYGVELEGLFGKPNTYAKAELPRRVKEALITDERVLDVYDFRFTKTNSKTEIHMNFTVKTIYGNVNTVPFTFINEPHS